MKEKNTSFLFLIFVSVITAMLILAAIFNLKAYLISEKALKMKLPSVKMEKNIYYRDAVGLISQAVNLNKLNADYLAFKADLLFSALAEDLGAGDNGGRKEIEDLYGKAISLNPINFEYHLKLGWFYAQMGSDRAEEEIEKAIMLYPSYYRNYLYFAKYYLRNKKEKEAYFNLLAAFYHGSNITWRTIMSEIRDDLKDSTPFSFNERKKQLIFSEPAPGAEIDLKKYGFPHVNVPLNIKVYIKSSTKPEVLLYKNNILFGHLKQVSSVEETDVYEFNIDPLAADVYLDALALKTSPAQDMEKIEFLQKFK